MFTIIEKISQTYIHLILAQCSLSMPPEKVRKPLVFRVTSNDGAFFSVLRVTSDDEIKIKIIVRL